LTGWTQVRHSSQYFIEKQKFTMYSAHDPNIP